VFPVAANAFATSVKTSARRQLMLTINQRPFPPEGRHNRAIGRGSQEPHRDRHFGRADTNYTMLLHLPDGYTPQLVRDALAAKIKTLPETLRASLTGDQGPEMRDWKRVAIAADIAIFFCDPHAPWQRATKENTVSVAVARLGWSGRPVPGRKWPREHWPPVGVPCVGPVP
jgi:hypothetical protein